MKSEKKPRKDLSEERGEYRPIYTVLIHGPDYQALSPTEKLVLLHLKLNLGPAGIGILYTVSLAEQTGYSEEGIRLAIDILSHRGWVRHERNVFWVVDGLRYEPSLSKKNDNHKGWLARYLKGLPKLLVVNEFAKRYADWLPPSWDGVGDGMPLPIAITSTSTTTVNTPASGEAPKKASSAKYPHYPTPVSQRLHAKWISTVGGLKYATFRSATSGFFLAPVPLYSEDQLGGAIEAFGEFFSGLSPKDAKYHHVHSWSADIKRFVRLGAMPPQLDDGTPTERGRVALGLVA